MIELGSRVLALPYEQRRVIGIVETVTPPPQKEAAAPTPGSIANVTATAIGIAAATFLPGFGFITLAAFGVKALADHLKAGRPLPFFPLTPAAAREELQVPPGHPLVGHVYVGHPLIPARYVPAAVFHRFLLEEKVNELVRLLAALGATRVRVLHRTGRELTGGLEGNVAAGDSVGGKVSAKNETKSQLMFEEEFRPEGDAKIPDDLVWYGHEASWQALAQRRLKHRTSKLRATLSYTESFGVDASLKASVEGVGLKLGGSFNDFESTSWEFEGEFA